MCGRFGRYTKVCAGVKAKAKSMGFGVTDEDHSDHSSGIFTVAHKLESMSTCYARMDALFRHWSNITPLGEFTLSVDEENGEGYEPNEDYGAIEDSEDDYTQYKIDENSPINNALKGDGISELSISSSPASQRRQKRQLTYTESQASDKRSRVADQRKKPPTPDPRSYPGMSERSFFSSYEPFNVKKAIGKEF
ncbi:hypothetical protein BGZ58_010239 [Dissophora ornata]|nr:hypothetical protein BGZ58_010239 [Dissophora ornata]